MGKHKAPKEYDMAALEDIDEDDELASYFKDWAKENLPKDWSKTTYNKAVEKYVAKSHLNEGKNWVSDNEHVLKH